MKNFFFLPDKNEIDGKAALIAYSALLIYIVSIFSQYIPVITNTMMVLVFASSIAFIFKKGSAAVFKKNKVLWGILIFFLLQLLSVFLSDNKKEGFQMLGNLAPFLLFAVSFCFLDFSSTTWNRLLSFFAVVTTLASVAGFGYGFYQYRLTQDNGYLYNDNICFILGKQAVYFAFYVSAAILIFIFQLIHQTTWHKSKGWIYLALAWLFCIVFLLASRTAMFSLLLILCIYLGSSLLRQKKYMEISILVLGLLFGSVILIKLFPKTLNRFKGTTETEYQFDNQNMENHFNADFDKNKWNSSNTRAAIWTCAMEVWKQSPVFGTGFGDKTEDLKKKYEEKKFWFALTTNKNTHNQYLDILIGMGITGLIAFLFCYLLFPFSIFLKRKQAFPLMIFSLLALCLLTENMFSRYQGIVVLAFLLPLSTKIEQPVNTLSNEEAL
jgi:O-antigen ligase